MCSLYLLFQIKMRLVVYSTVNVYSSLPLRFYVSPSLCFEGFSFLESCKQDLPACQCFFPQQSTALSLYLKFGFSGSLKTDFMLPACIGPTPPHHIAAAQESCCQSISAHALPGQAAWLEASLAGWCHCLADKISTNWSS